MLRPTNQRRTSSPVDRAFLKRSGIRLPPRGLRERDRALCAVEELLRRFIGRLEEHETPASELARQGMNRREMRPSGTRVSYQPSEALSGRRCFQAGMDRRWETRVRPLEASVHRQTDNSAVLSQSTKSVVGAWTAGSQRSRHCVQHCARSQREAVRFCRSRDFRPTAPANHTAELFAAWEGRIELEAKRVVYVAVTRARCVVALAVPAVFAARCQAILDRAQVSFEICPPDL